MRAADVARAMYPDYKEERAAAHGAAAQAGNGGWFGLKRAKAVKFKLPDAATEGGAIPIRGINSDLPVRFAPNGGAVPGDRIVGILTPGEGITIYPIQSPALKDFEDTPERWLDLRWDVEERTPQRFPARITLQTVNEPGTLAQVAQVIAEHDGNIDNIRMTRQSPDFTVADDRSRGLRPQASQLDHRAAARQGRGRERRACRRLEAGSFVRERLAEFLPIK